LYKAHDFDKYRASYPQIDEDQWGRLADMTNALVEWNSKINLVSRKDIDSVIPNHIMPSLAISRVRMFNDEEAVIDIGTGGGLPGLPLAIVNPTARFTLLGTYM
jgi:16S rRNA (guanine527-N7)-methyltransferase